MSRLVGRSASSGRDNSAEVTDAGPTAEFVIIQSVSLVFSDSAVPPGMGAFRLHLYSASPTAIADNAVFDLLEAGL